MKAGPLKKSPGESRANQQVRADAMSELRDRGARGEGDLFQIAVDALLLQGAVNEVDRELRGVRTTGQAPDSIGHSVGMQRFVPQESILVFGANLANITHRSAA
jgi:hypothetical protein